MGISATGWKIYQKSNETTLKLIKPPIDYAKQRKDNEGLNVEPKNHMGLLSKPLYSNIWMIEKGTAIK